MKNLTRSALLLISAAVLSACGETKPTAPAPAATYDATGPWKFVISNVPGVDFIKNTDGKYPNGEYVSPTAIGLVMVDKTTGDFRSTVMNSRGENPLMGNTSTGKLSFAPADESEGKLGAYTDCVGKFDAVKNTYTGVCSYQGIPYFKLTLIKQ